MRAGLSWLRILGDLVRFLCLGLRSRTSLAAENLFLRKKLALHQERRVSFQHGRCGRWHARRVPIYHPASITVEISASMSATLRPANRNR